MGRTRAGIGRPVEGGRGRTCEVRSPRRGSIGPDCRTMRPTAPPHDDAGRDGTGPHAGPGDTLRRVEPRVLPGPAEREGAVGTPGPETRSPISGRSWLVEPRADLPGEPACRRSR